MAFKKTRFVSSIDTASRISIPRQYQQHFPDIKNHLINNKQPLATMEQRTRRRVVLPSVWMRSGTSKGLFLHKKDLPAMECEWGNLLLSAMGSRDGDQRQLDGIGGATSTTSKVAIISKSKIPGIDVEYTFVQIGVGTSKVDFSGNCGNICSGVGPFALDEGLVVPRPGQTELDVSIFNTNTSRKIVQRLQVSPDGRFQEDGDYIIGGVKGTASQIKVTFVDPAGSMTNKLFPTGCRQEELEVESDLNDFSIQVSMVDAANPFVFVDAATMPPVWQSFGRNDPAALEIVEAIRCTAAVRMGLAINKASAHLVRGTPKIAVLSPTISKMDDRCEIETPADISVTSYSMGKMHPSFQLTGAVCLGAAVSIPGTIAYDVSKRQIFATPPGTPSESSIEHESLPTKASEAAQRVMIQHPSGRIEAEVVSNSGDGTNGLVEVKGVTVSRTARRLFEGNVLINI